MNPETQWSLAASWALVQKLLQVLQALSSCFLSLDSASRRALSQGLASLDFSRGLAVCAFSQLSGV